MSEQENEKTFDHAKTGISDKIRLVAELEHIRSHALRSAVATWREEDDSESNRYIILAKRAQELRREYMRKHFPEVKDPDWCLCKAASSLRQVAYETFEGNTLELKELDDFVDEIWGAAINKDLSDCEACRDDRGV